MLLLFGSCRRNRENNRLNLSTLQRMEWTICCVLGEIPVDGFCIHDGPSHVDLLVVAYHRNDIGSVIIRIGAGVATDPLDVVQCMHAPCVARVLGR